MAAHPAPSFLFWFRWVVFALAMAGMGWGFIHEAERNISRHSRQAQLLPLETRHLELTRTTQKDFKPDFTHSVSEPLKKLAPHRTDGLVQPLWPWLGALRLDEGDVAQSLQDLAWLRTGLALACLLVLGWVCARSFALPAALLVVALTGFHGLLGTLHLYTGATLFHFCFLLTWIACLYALQRNSLWVYGVVGVFGALAYLSMDRILPLLAIFAVVSTLRAVWGWLAAHWCHHEGTTLWVRRNHLFGLLLLATMAGFVAGGRLTEARTQFGDAFFHYNDHTRWLDTKAEVEAWVEAHPDKQSLQKIPALSRPTPQSYFENHTQVQVQQRLKDGLKALLKRLQGRGGEVLAVLLVLLVAFTATCRFCTPKACHAGERLHPEAVPTVLFLVVTTVGYGLVAIWDAQVLPVGYIHALTGPLVLSLLWGCESVLRRAKRRGASWLVKRGYQGVLWILLIMTLVQFWQGTQAAAP